MTFDNIYDRLAEPGQFRPKRDLRRRKIIIMNQGDDYLVGIANNLQLSNRRLSFLNIKKEGTIS